MSPCLADDGPLVAGDRVGRYVIERTLGAGAMGVVYAARDPELGRSLALKLLRPEQDGARADVLRERLLGEARALARLAHPNVVTLYDVGTFGDRVFFGMELVEGVTLAAWLATRRRRGAEILDLMRQAGEGLRAAHAAGFVHGDLKPENVLVGDDGRVRVTDFGLARGSEADGESVQSDVYAFCTTLHEALHGARPGEATAKKRGVARWLDCVIARGLRADPQERWPSMSAVLDAIDRGRARRRRAIVAATVVTVGLVAGTAFALRPRAAPPPCAASDAAFDAAWSDARRAAVRAAFLRAAPNGEGEERFDAVARELDRYGGAFVGGHRDVCLATRVRGDQSEAMLDARMRCLDLRLRQAGAFVGLLEHADADGVANAASAAHRLPDVAFCANRASLTARAAMPVVPPSADTEAFDRTYAEVAARVQFDPQADVVERLDALERLAATIGDRGRAARVARVRGERWLRNGRFDSALDDLHAAAAGALSVGDDELLADAWVMLVRAETLSGAPDGADRAAAEARAAIVRMGGDDTREGLRLYYVAAARLEVDGDVDDADRIARDAERAYARAGKPDDPNLASAWDMLSNTSYQHGDYAAAAALEDRAIDLRTRLVGKDHWLVDMARTNRDVAWIKLGRVDEGIAELEAVRARHPAWHYVVGSIALGLRAKGDVAAALARDTDNARRIDEEKADSYNLRLALDGEGEDLVLLGREREARAPLERSLATPSPALPPTEVARAEALLARALVADHAPAERVVKLCDSACDRLRRVAAHGDVEARALLDQIAKWQSGLPATSPIRRACATP